MGTWRYNMVYGALVLAVMGLGVRLALLVQGGQGRAEQLAERQQRMVTPLPGRPGSVFARTQKRYVLMAASKQMPSCFADPFLLENREIADTATAMADALGLDPIETQERLLLRRRKRFVWIKRGISTEEAAAVRALRLPGVGITHEWVREYPNKSLAGTVLGFRLRDGQPGGGVELTEYDHLAAVDGRRVMLADAYRRPISPLPGQSVPPRDGGHVYLTIDPAIQGYLQEVVARSVGEFGAKWGTGVVLDPFTGEVLAMTSCPTFSPDEFNKVPAEMRINRAITMPFEPGSVMKPIFAAAAVQEGVVAYDTRIFCENGMYYPPRGGRITDHGHHYGWLTLTDIVVKSSNIGMAKIGAKLGNARLYQVAEQFGLGQKTGVALPGESRGIIRDLRKWDTYSTPRVPFGQEMAATTLQVAAAFCPLVNGGVLMRPRIVDRRTDAADKVIWSSQPEAVRRVLSPEIAAQSLAALREVVVRGTGKSCQLQRWQSFGKTGTAQIPGPGGYVDGAYTGSFVGGAPVTKPRLVCMISIFWPERSKGYYGSKVAAPYVKEVLQRSLAYLDVPPDHPDWVASHGRADGLTMTNVRGPGR